MTHTLTATIRSEGDGFVALCPELDIASQGASIAEARANLQEAVELFLESAHPKEISERLRSHVVMQKSAGDSTITVPVPLHAELRVGTLQAIVRQSGISRSEFES